MVGPQQALPCPCGNSFDTNGAAVAYLRDLDPSSPSPVCTCRGRNPFATRVERRRDPLGRRSYRARPEPGVELVLDRPLNDQPGAEPSELAEHLLRVVDEPTTEQLVDLSLYLRRWRYGASHGCDTRSHVFE